MKKSLSLLAFALCSALPAAQAMPKAAGNKKMVTRILSGPNALQLFGALDLPLSGTDEAREKIFEGKENPIGISCRQNSFLATACSVSVQADEMEDAEEMMLFGGDAKALYESMSGVVYVGRIGDAKIFSDTDESVKILCSRSVISNGNRYACSVDLVRN
ncbi:MAG: hypothetical protein AB7K68_06210 [Bacteriovoracia bacterium]